jgi:hypothetical protein
VPKNLIARLSPHPETPCPAVESIAVRVRDGSQHLEFDYRVAGQIDHLAVPAPAPAARVDGLWQHTCCEAFVGQRGLAAYREFNFAPSGHWAAYDFTDTRSRGADPALAAPAIEAASSATELQVIVRIAVRDLGASGPFDLGLSVVVETRDGRRSYWALCHPAPHPDFHHRAAFALRLDLTP